MPLAAGRCVRPVVFVLSLLLCGGAARAQEDDPASQNVAPTAFGKEEPALIPGWGVGDGKSHLVPVLDIFGFLTALSLVDRWTITENSHHYDSSWSSFERNLKGEWVYDSDPFEINQFLHPYQGGMHHGFARSAGQGFWTSMGYAHFGSLAWELAGETTPPSINDQVMTGFGGSFLGEALFRLASLTLESGGGTVGPRRELSAALILPASGFNRWAYGQRFDGVFRSRDPAVYTRGQVGANVTSTLKSNVDLDELPDSQKPQSYERGEAVADFTVAYGMPGKPGYRYQRPFDYFHLQLTAATGNVLENLMVRGLLWGDDYAVGDGYRGVWGLYGTYDYIAPQIFRVSTTGFGLGTAGQWWLSSRTALQGEVVGGASYGSGGIIDGRGERDYHNGVTPQGLLGMRFIMDDKAAIDLAARHYHITNLGSDADDGWESISRGEIGVTFRVKGLHGISLRYVASRREAHYGPDSLPDTRQTVGALTVAYAYLGHKWLGAVDWRPGARLKD